MLRLYDPYKTPHFEVQLLMSFSLAVSKSTEYFNSGYKLFANILSLYYSCIWTTVSLADRNWLLAEVATTASRISQPIAQCSLISYYISIVVDCSCRSSNGPTQCFCGTIIILVSITVNLSPVCLSNIPSLFAILLLLQILLLLIIFSLILHQIFALFTTHLCQK